MDDVSITEETDVSYWYLEISSDNMTSGSHVK